MGRKLMPMMGKAVLPISTTRGSEVKTLSIRTGIRVKQRVPTAIMARPKRMEALRVFRHLSMFLAA